MPDSPIDPLSIRDELETLLTAVEGLPELSAELDRAKREFFGGRDPRTAGEDAAELAALRFVEWFLCERVSDVLGAVPLDVAQTRLGISIDVPTGSVVGVFLVQSGGADPVVRDVVDKSVYQLRGVPDPLEIGDALIGRLYPAGGGDDEMVPSAAASIVSSAPRFAVAFQKDVEALALGRRLDQLELENLLFVDATPPAQDAAPPLERVEAELATLLESGASPVSAPEVTEALRSSERPTAVVDELLDQLAFESDVDLEALRRVLVDLVGAIASRPAEPAPQQTEARPPPKAPPAAPKFEARQGEGLGESIARRIEEGLAQHESVESLFAHVEGMLGESIDDEVEERLVGVDVGDLEPLVREFAWELEVEESDVQRLDAFLTAQNGAPVPRANLETVEADDVLRFLLHAWLDRPGDARVAEVRARFSIVERFYAWAADTQGIDRRDELEPARTELLADVDRLARAGDALSRAEGTDSPGDRASAALFVVVDVDDETGGVASPRRGSRTTRGAGRPRRRRFESALGSA